MLFKGDKGIGSPSAPINRRDKNVRSTFMTGVRLFLYLLDAVSVRIVVKKAFRSGAGFVIFDRYIYDELANLNLRNPAIRAYVRLLMRLVPRPDVSYLLDADPLLARARKPEYPLDFLYANRQAYLELADLVDGITVIAPMPIKEVARRVLERAVA
jgi:thymidylate kinase